MRSSVIASFTLIGMTVCSVAMGADKNANLPFCEAAKIFPYNNCVGVLNFPDGGQYIGAFVDGKPNGFGAATSPDKKMKIEGMFKDGAPNGEGRFIDYNVRKYKQGVWAADGSVKWAEPSYDLEAESPPVALVKPAATAQVVTLGFPKFPSLK